MFANGMQVGSVTSAGYGHRIQKNIAYAYVEPQSSSVDTRLTVGILGDQYDAIVVSSVQYDPENQKMRA